MDSLNREEGKDNTKFIAQLIDSMLSLINGLVDDISNVHDVKKDISVIETKLAFLIAQITQLDQLCKTLVEEETFKEEVGRIRGKITRLEEGIKKLTDSITLIKETQITNKKDIYIEQGKMIIIGAILLTAAMQIILALLKKIAPFLSATL